MVLIFSTADDSVTNLVIDYIHYFDGDFIRINEKNLPYISKIEIGKSDSFEIGYFNSLGVLNKICSEKLTSYWYRRGQLFLKPIDIDYTNEKLFELNIKLEKNEYAKVNSYIHFLLNKSNIRHINSFNDIFENKLIAYDIAKYLKLNIPESLVTTRKNDLIDFCKKHNNVITKSIFENVINFKAKDNLIVNYTTLIALEDLEQIPEEFACTLFQKYIEKKIELRIFYLDGKFYPMAIFSQQNKQTKVDFRHYDIERPNRNVPFKLPSELEIKLNNLMKMMRYNCGSIDMIYTHEGDYVFLEVNPVGQFSQISNPCNYNLPKKIAKYLLDEKEN